MVNFISQSKMAKWQTYVDIVHKLLIIAILSDMDKTHSFDSQMSQLMHLLNSKAHLNELSKTLFS